ncbi:MAG TPA: FAD-dependent oxidoreductase [Anaerolineales bacterium]|nr:FAD-dependent oxidoreductase [Anaerolineales bacterium]
MYDTDSPEAIVVGGGLVGSSIAYHLTRAGVSTLLIEQGDLASGASGANFGNVQVADAEFGLSLDLTLRSFARFATLEAELDYPVGFLRTGSLLLIENAQQLALMQERAARLQAVGLRVALLDRDETRRLEPFLDPEAFLGALYHPDEGTLDPFRLVRAFVRRGQGHGLALWTHTRVSGIEIKGARVTGVVTSRGRVSARWVILAAGAWAYELGLTAGVGLPLAWVQGEAAVTEPVENVAQNTLATAAFFESTEGSGAQTVGFCLRQRPRGHVMMGEAASVTRALGRTATAAALPLVAREACRWLPGLRRANVVRTWAIPVAFTADHRPLLGPVDGVDGLVAATALKSTIILTPVVGELVAELITTSHWDPRLGEFSPTRTGGP